MRFNLKGVGIRKEQKMGESSSGMGPMTMECDLRMTRLTNWMGKMKMF